MDLFGAAFSAPASSGLAAPLSSSKYLQRRLQTISSTAEAIIRGDTRRECR